MADLVLKDANGEMSYESFNRYSKHGELRLMDWITGDITGQNPPEPYITQKNKDWAATFIKKYPAQVIDGIISRPKDYYGFENLYMVGSYIRKNSDCNDDEPEYDPSNESNQVIELLDGVEFNRRSTTHIKLLRPSFKKPIAKSVGDNFEFIPKDIGAVKLEYYRYPKFAEVKTKVDELYNNEVPDPLTSINYEWDEKARTILIWFIIDAYANRNSNQAMKQFNQATAKESRA